MKLGTKSNKMKWKKCPKCGLREYLYRVHTCLFDAMPKKPDKTYSKVEIVTAYIESHKDISEINNFLNELRR